MRLFYSYFLFIVTHERNAVKIISAEFPRHLAISARFLYNEDEFIFTEVSSC